jgi:heptaprenyl diphosphate synthase
MDLRLADFYGDSSELMEILQDVEDGLFEAGSHFRSNLLFKTAESLELNIEDFVEHARVIELVHNATLVHDDVIDRSTSRRGHPTLNQIVNNKMAVLTGDFMLSRAMYELSSVAPNEVVAELALTLKDLVEGEIFQSQQNNNGDWNFANYYHLCDKKTASLIRWCLLCPAIISKKDEEELKRLRVLAYHLGVLYQMIDDLKDFVNIEEKTPYLDIKNWNINFVLIYLKENDLSLYNQIKEDREIDNLTDQEKRRLLNVILKCIKRVQEELDTTILNAASLNQVSLYIKEKTNAFFEKCYEKAEILTCKAS